MDNAKGTRVARRGGTLALTIVSAVVVAVAFVAMTMVRHNYDHLPLEFVAIELAVALVASFVASMVSKGLDERGAAWAAKYVQPGPGPLYTLMSVLPSVATRAAIITACLSIPNATYVATELFRETVVMPPLAVLIRFLADIPQALLLCLAVRMALQRSRSKEVAEESTTE